MAFVDDGISPLRVVSGYDRRLDPQMDLKGYLKTRDPSAVKPLPGRQPRWFVLRPLSVDDHLACDSAAAPEHKFIRALIFGLERFEDPETGIALEPTGEIAGRDRPIWTSKDLAELKRRAGGQQTLYEIGIVIYKRSESSGNDWSGGDSSLAPPQLSDEAERSARLRAEQTPPT